MGLVWGVKIQVNTAKLYTNYMYSISNNDNESRFSLCINQQCHESDIKDIGDYHDG